MSKTSETRDLSWTDTAGNSYKYYKNPLTQVCFFILLQEACERLTFYGLTPNLQSYLLGEHGAPGFVSSTAEANQYLNLFNGIMYFVPIITAVIADGFLGVFNTIIIFSGIYMAGLIFLTSSSLTAEKWMFDLGFMALLTTGAGGIKGCINVFGGHQFHPVQQKAKLTTFFTLFYAAINVGGLIGSFACPPIQENVSWFAGFMIPTVSFFLAVIVFLLGYKRYVIMKPQGSVVLRIIRVVGSAIRKGSFEKCKVSQGGDYEDNFIEDAKAIISLVPLFALSLPFIVTYAQLSTTFLTQAKKMDLNIFGVKMPAAQILTADTVFVIIGSMVVGKFVYPQLEKRGKMPSILQRFSIGCVFGILAMMMGFTLEKVIKANSDHPQSVSVFWQVPQFAFIAFGEIFIFSTCYEMAFSHSPDSLKAFGSALFLLFFSMGNFLAAFFTSVFASWQTGYNLTGEDALVTVAEQKAAILTARYDDYFLVLAGLCLVGMFASLALNPYYQKIKALADARKLVHEEQKNQKSLK